MLYQGVTETSLKRLNTQDLFLENDLIFHICLVLGELADNSLKKTFMSLWAWLTYSSTYAWVALKMPLSLTLWEHLYTLNSLLVIQETADTFGLVCLGFLFLSAQIFSRNFILSVFLLAPTQSSSMSMKSEDSTKVNNVKTLSHTTTASSHLQNLLSSTLRSLRTQLRQK